MRPTAATRRELADLSADLRPRVEALILAAPMRVGITSAWRSYDEQKRLYDGWKTYGRPRFNPANPPGVSKHEHTANGQPAADAADLRYPGSRGTKERAAAVAWVHGNAANFGLHFPIRREDWHAESNGRPFRADPPQPEPVEDDVALSDDDKKWLTATITQIADDRLRILLRAEKADGTPTGHDNLRQIVGLLHDIQREGK